jgi:hypothetical protein
LKQETSTKKDVRTEIKTENKKINLDLFAETSFFFKTINFKKKEEQRQK